MKKNIALFLFIIFITACSQTKEDDKKIEKIKTTAPGYQIAVVQKAGVSSIVKLPAQLIAYQEVSIFPKVNGYVKTVAVDIGSKVKKGNLLMILEAPELQQAVLQAKEKYARTKSDWQIDKEHYLRLIEASKTAGAISPIEISVAKAKVESDSALCNAEKANWQMQQTMIDYLRVTAPFDGIITERNVHPGALVNASAKDKPMLELKQVSHLRLTVEVPETIAGQLKTKDSVAFFTSAFPGKKMEGLISRKSENINSQYRSEKVEIDVLNETGLLFPGMYADVVIKTKGSRDALSIPKSAIIISTEKKYLNVLRNNKIEQVEVITGNESVNKIEVFGNISAGEKIIINANEEIK
jgi:RND family efflux transporter MFP subunit